MKRILASKYFKLGLTMFLTIMAVVCVCSLFFLGSNVLAHMKAIMRIVMPVIDGLAIAYIATPILNFIEQKILYSIIKNKSY